MSRSTECVASTSAGRSSGRVVSRLPEARDARGVSFDLDRAWRLHPQVALRPERFGALAYHFGTRRLSFLKTSRLLRVVELLAEYPSGRDACVAAGVSASERDLFTASLAVLAETGMICERPMRAEST
jgi:putative mycofactocin binding protein MftB